MYCCNPSNILNISLLNMFKSLASIVWIFPSFLVPWYLGFLKAVFVKVAGFATWFYGFSDLGFALWFICGTTILYYWFLYTSKPCLYPDGKCKLETMKSHEDESQTNLAENAPNKGSKTSLRESDGKLVRSDSRKDGKAKQSGANARLKTELEGITQTLDRLSTQILDHEKGRTKSKFELDLKKESSEIKLAEEKETSKLEVALEKETSKLELDLKDKESNISDQKETEKLGVSQEIIKKSQHEFDEEKESFDLGLADKAEEKDKSSKTQLAKKVEDLDREHEQEDSKLKMNLNEKQDRIKSGDDQNQKKEKSKADLDQESTGSLHLEQESKISMVEEGQIGKESTAELDQQDKSSEAALDEEKKSLKKKASKVDLKEQDKTPNITISKSGSKLTSQKPTNYSQENLKISERDKFLTVVSPKKSKSGLDKTTLDSKTEQTKSNLFETEVRQKRNDIRDLESESGKSEVSTTSYGLKSSIRPRERDSNSESRSKDLTIEFEPVKKISEEETAKRGMKSKRKSGERAKKSKGEVSDNLLALENIVDDVKELTEKQQESFQDMINVETQAMLDHQRQKNVLREGVSEKKSGFPKHKQELRTGKKYPKEEKDKKDAATVPAKTISKAKTKGRSSSIDDNDDWEDFEKLMKNIDTMHRDKRKDLEDLLQNYDSSKEDRIKKHLLPGNIKERGAGSSVTEGAKAYFDDRKRPWDTAFREKSFFGKDTLEGIEQLKDLKHWPAEKILNYVNDVKDKAKSSLPEDISARFQTALRTPQDKKFFSLTSPSDGGMDKPFFDDQKRLMLGAHQVLENIPTEEMKDWPAEKILDYLNAKQEQDRAKVMLRTDLPSVLSAADKATPQKIMKQTPAQHLRLKEDLSMTQMIDIPGVGLIPAKNLPDFTERFYVEEMKHWPPEKILDYIKAFEDKTKFLLPTDMHTDISALDRTPVKKTISTAEPFYGNQGALPPSIDHSYGRIPGVPYDGTGLSTQTFIQPPGYEKTLREDGGIASTQQTFDNRNQFLIQHKQQFVFPNADAITQEQGIGGMQPLYDKSVMLPPIMGSSSTIEQAETFYDDSRTLMSSSKHYDPTFSNETTRHGDDRIAPAQQAISDRDRMKILSQKKFGLPTTNTYVQDQDLGSAVPIYDKRGVMPPQVAGSSYYAGQQVDLPYDDHRKVLSPQQSLTHEKFLYQDDKMTRTPMRDDRKQLHLGDILHEAKPVSLDDEGRKLTTVASYHDVEDRMLEPQQKLFSTKESPLEPREELLHPIQQIPYGDKGRKLFHDTGMVDDRRHVRIDQVSDQTGRFQHEDKVRELFHDTEMVDDRRHARIDQTSDQAGRIQHDDERRRLLDHFGKSRLSEYQQKTLEDPSYVHVDPTLDQSGRIPHRDKARRLLHPERAKLPKTQQIVDDRDHIHFQTSNQTRHIPRRQEEREGSVFSPYRVGAGLLSVSQRERLDDEHPISSAQRGYRSPVATFDNNIRRSITGDGYLDNKKNIQALKYHPSQLDPKLRDDNGRRAAGKDLTDYNALVKKHLGVVTGPSKLLKETVSADVSPVIKGLSFDDDCRRATIRFDDRKRISSVKREDLYKDDALKRLEEENIFFRKALEIADNMHNELAVRHVAALQEIRELSREKDIPQKIRPPDLHLENASKGLSLRPHQFKNKMEKSLSSARLKLLSAENILKGLNERPSRRDKHHKRCPEVVAKIATSKRQTNKQRCPEIEAEIETSKRLENTRRCPAVEAEIETSKKLKNMRRCPKVEAEIEASKKLRSTRTCPEVEVEIEASKKLKNTRRCPEVEAEIEASKKLRSARRCPEVEADIETSKRFKSGPRCPEVEAEIERSKRFQSMERYPET